MDTKLTPGQKYQQQQLEYGRKRRAQVLALYEHGGPEKAGLKVKEVAERMGFSRARAQAMIAQAIRERGQQ